MNLQVRSGVCLKALVLESHTTGSGMQGSGIGIPRSMLSQVKAVKLFKMSILFVSYNKLKPNYKHYVHTAYINILKNITYVYIYM